MNDVDCVFCKIVKREIPSLIVFEDGNTLAFLNILPNNLGHTLVIPKKHFENIYSIPDDELSRVLSASKKVAIAVKSALNAEGFNIISNNESAAGQVVMHIHFHIIPRYKNDGYVHWQGKQRTTEEMSDAAKKIRNKLK